MPGTEPDSPLLARKLAARPDPLERPGMTPAKAMRRALTRALDGCAGLEASVSGFGEDRLGLADVVESLSGPLLIFMTRGPEGAIGLGVWDLASVAAVIEHLITGRVVPAPPEERSPTPTDAAVLVEMFDRIMTRFDEFLEEAEERPPVAGFRAASIMEDGRAVSMALEDMEYRQYRIRIDFANGAKHGELRLVFPWCSPASALRGAAAARRWQREWQAVVKSASVTLDAVLHRVRMPLEQVAALRAGDVITLPRQALERVSIEGVDRRRIMFGKLGRLGAFRAVRLQGEGVREAPAGPALAAPRSSAGQGAPPAPGGGADAASGPGTAAPAPDAEAAAGSAAASPAVPAPA